MLEPEELDDSYFMLRVRIDGGALTTEQLRALGEISQTYARDTADVTDRQNIQYHWIEIEDMPAIWQRLESLGLLTTEACGDTPRVILGSPVAGIAADEVIDPQPAIDTILERYIGDTEFSNLPRKFKTAISVAAGRRARGQRHLVRRRRAPRARPRLRPVGRRRPVDQPEDRAAARRLGAARRGAGRLGRRHLDLPRLRLPPAAAPRADQVPGRRLGRREVPPGAARTSTCTARWSTGPRPATPERPIDHVGVHKQSDGLNYVGVAPASGRVSGTTLVALADAVERGRLAAGSGSPRSRRSSCSTCRTARSTR